MSKANYGRMSTDEVVQAFIDTASRVRCPWNFRAPPQTKTPETDEIIQTIKAIASELAVRKPVAQARAR